MFFFYLTKQINLVKTNIKESYSIKYRKNKSLGIDRGVVSRTLETISLEERSIVSVCVSKEFRLIWERRYSSFSFCHHTPRIWTSSPRDFFYKSANNNTSSIDSMYHIGVIVHNTSTIPNQFC